MNKNVSSEISLDDPVFTPLIMFSLHKYSKRHKKKKIHLDIIYNLTLQALEHLDFFPPAKSDPTSFAMGVHIYNPIYENSITELIKQGLVETREEKLLLTEDGLKVFHMLIDRTNKTSSTNVFEFLDKEVNEFNKDISSQSKTIMKGHKEIIAQLRKIGSQIDQHFPSYLSRLEKKLLFAIYKNKEFASNEINKFSTDCARNSVYNALKRMESKGFVKNHGEGFVNYKLTKIGEAQAKWYAGREIS